MVLVLSGKGGVGKSTITTELALALRHAGKKVSTSTCNLSLEYTMAYYWGKNKKKKFVY